MFKTYVILHFSPNKRNNVLIEMAESFENLKEWFIFSGFLCVRNRNRVTCAVEICCLIFHCLLVI